PAPPPPPALLGRGGPPPRPMRNVALALASLPDCSAAPLSAAQLRPATVTMAPAIMDMDPDITDPVTVITAVRPMSPTTTMAAASGSDSGSGTAMAGGFAACGFAAEVHSSSLQTGPASPEIACSRGRLSLLA